MLLILQQRDSHRADVAAVVRLNPANGAGLLLLLAGAIAVLLLVNGVESLIPVAEDDALVGAETEAA